MPFPEYIPTRMVSVGGAAVIESGQLLRTQVSIRASRSLIWGDTGYRFERSGVADSSEQGTEVEIELPCTDTPGWRTTSGNVIDVSEPDSYTHQYTATVTFMLANGQRATGIPSYTIGPFVLPAGESTIDLDLTVPASTVSGGQVHIPDAWTSQIEDIQETVDNIEAGILNTDGSTLNQVPTADGDGSWTWEDQIGGGGGLNEAGVVDLVEDDQSALHEALMDLIGSGGLGESGIVALLEDDQSNLYTAVEALAGQDGAAGPPQEMRVDSGFIQTRPVGSGPGNWSNVIELTELQGDPGPPGTTDYLELDNTPSLADVATSGSYADLDDTPTIPSEPGDIGAQPAGDYVEPGDLANVATSGAYSDLDGTPNLNNLPYRADDWMPTIGDIPGLEDELGDKVDAETLADVATSGAYSDLTGTPSIPSEPGDIGAAPTVHTHSMAAVTGLEDALDDKADEDSTPYLVRYDNGWPAERPVPVTRPCTLSDPAGDSLDGNGEPDDLPNWLVTHDDLRVPVEVD